VQSKTSKFVNKLGEFFELNETVFLGRITEGKVNLVNNKYHSMKQPPSLFPSEQCKNVPTTSLKVNQVVLYHLIFGRDVGIVNWCV
jgi:hypothetical protein